MHRLISEIDEIHKEGNITLKNGETIMNINTIIYCTGYGFNFPFLNNIEGLVWDKDLIGPLFHHTFFALDPTLIFIGVPQYVASFPFFELQARWAAQFLNGNYEKALLPEKEAMLASLSRWAESRKDQPRSKFHVFVMYQWPFCNMMRDVTGTPREEPAGTVGEPCTQPGRPVDRLSGR